MLKIDVKWMLVFGHLECQNHMSNDVGIRLCYDIVHCICYVTPKIKTNKILMSLDVNIPMSKDVESTLNGRWIW